MGDNLINIQGVVYHSKTPPIKIDPAKLEEYKGTMSRDDKDNIIFQQDNDIYMAAGYGLPVKGLVPGNTIDFNYREAKVLAVDAAANEVTNAPGYYSRVFRGGDIAVGGILTTAWDQISNFFTPATGVVAGRTVDEKKPAPLK